MLELSLLQRCVVRLTFSKFIGFKSARERVSFYVSKSLSQNV